MTKEIIAIIGNSSESLINFRSDLIKRWSELGYKVIVFTPDLNKDYKSKINSLNSNVYVNKYHLNRVGINPFKDLYSIFDLYNKLKKEKPNYIFSYTIKPVIYSSIISYFINLKGMYSLIPGLGYAFSKGDFKSKLINKMAVNLYKYFLENNDKVFFQNPDDRNLFVERNLINKEKTVLINGSGVNIDEFHKTPPIKEKLRFLVMARVLKSKGIKEFIEAAKIIKNKYQDVEFDLLGSPGKGPDAFDINVIKEASNDDIINYWGRQENVKPYIKKCSVYILPSYREGTPRSVLESMSMGKPIITTDVPGCRETVMNGVNGFLIPPKDSVSLARKIEHFIKNKEDIINMGKKSREIAEKKYDVHKVNEIIIKEMGLI